LGAGGGDRGLGHGAGNSIDGGAVGGAAPSGPGL
jgi:hypothetical protein